MLFILNRQHSILKLKILMTCSGLERKKSRWQHQASKDIEKAIEHFLHATILTFGEGVQAPCTCICIIIRILQTLGGFHAGAVVQVKQIAAALARSKGSEESEATSQLFGKLSLTLQRCNAMMLSSRQQDSDFVPPEIDGIMWFFDINCPNFS